KDNLLGAMDSAFGMQDWKSVMRIRIALDRFLYLRGFWDDAVRSGRQAEAVARRVKNEREIVYFTTCVAMIRNERGEYEETVRVYREALEIFRSLGDENNVAVCLHQLGWIAESQGNLEEAKRLLGESLEISKRLNEQHSAATTLHE